MATGSGGGLGSTPHTRDSHRGAQPELKYWLMRTIVMAETDKEEKGKQGIRERKTVTPGRRTATTVKQSGKYI